LDIKTAIDKILEEIDNTNLPVKEKIIFILQEILMNTYEHALHKLSKQKEKKKTATQEAKKSVDIKISFNLIENKYLEIFYEENSKGFDISILNDIELHKYHGRGIKIVKHHSTAMFYNPQGNKIKIFIKVNK